MALLWSGLSFSALGDEFYAVALSWIAVQLLGSNAGYLVAVQAFVVLLAVLGIGRWADRWNRQRSMIGADLARAAILLVVVALWLTSGAPSVVQLTAAVLVLAVGEAVFEPALQSMMPSLVDDKTLLPAANSLLDATERSARLLGPGLVALLAGIVPLVHFLTFDAATFLVSALAVFCIRRLRPHDLVHAGMRREGLWQAIGRGVAAMRSQPGYVLATNGLLNGAWYAAFYLGVPLFIARYGVQGPGGSGIGAFGLVLSAYGCTNLAANMVLGSRTLPRQPQFQMFAGELFVGTGIIMMGLARFLPQAWLLPALAASAAFGAVGGPMQDIPVAVLRQTRLAPADIPAAMRVSMAASNGGKLLAMLLAPTLLLLVGVVPVIVACGFVLIGIGALGLVRYAAWVEPEGSGAPALPPAAAMPS
jgi:MFS family permease